MGGVTLKKGLVIRDYFDEIWDSKIKMAVLVGSNSVDQTLKFVMINSRITQMAQSKPELRDRHVLIAPQSYPFLKTLSHISCTQIISRHLSKLQRRLDTGDAQIRGELSRGDLTKVIEQICLAKTVSRKDQRIVSAKFRLAPVIERR